MVEVIRNPQLDDQQLNRLFAAAWPEHTWREFGPVLEKSLLFLGGFSDELLIAYVNVAWDGGLHGFILDTTVHPDYQRQGVALRMLQQAAAYAEKSGLEWLHVDFECQYARLYEKAGYKTTAAGIIRLKQ